METKIVLILLSYELYSYYLMEFEYILSHKEELNPGSEPILSKTLISIKQHQMEWAETLDSLSPIMVSLITAKQKFTSNMFLFIHFLVLVYCFSYVSVCFLYFC